MGAPSEEETFIGPMISAGEAERLHGWILSAIENGATLLFVANGDAAVATAQRVREAMGVGEVVVSQVPSGLAEVTILVGKDLSDVEDDVSTDPVA